MTEFETKDSGQHEQYDSGMRRDTSTGKPRFDLIRTKRQPYDDQMITRYAKLLARGAAKYDPRNWENGDSEEELDRAQESLLRHVEQLIAGETDEDHAAAVWFNTQAVEYFRWRIEQKKKKSASMTVQFAFDGSASGEDMIEILTGGTLRMVRGNLKPGPPATPEDRIRAKVNLAAARQYASPTKDTVLRRVGDWLAHYGIELLEGDLGDTYDQIDIVEFDQRLKHGAKIIRKPEVDDAPSFD